jgi:hypothetical protein
VSAVLRALPLWVALMVAYGITLGVDATPGSRLSAPEAHRLLVAESIVSDRDVNLADEYRTHAWRRWYDRPLRPSAPTTDGRLVEPQALGFEVLIAPAYAVAGPTGVRLLLAAVSALAFCLAAALGRMLVPEPWATRAAMATGLSPPAIGAATAVSPEMMSAAALAGATLLALRVRLRPRLRWTVATAVLVAVLPWLSAKLVAPAAVVAVGVARWLYRRQRGLAGFVALELVLTSAVIYVVVNDRLFGGPTPNDVARHGATGASGLGAHLARWPRLAEVWLDPRHGLLVWAPFLILAFVALGLWWRSRHGRLAVAVAEQADVEVAAAFLTLITAAVVLTAVFLAPSLDGSGRGWWHARQLVPALPPLAALSGWGLRFAPRTGTALAIVTVAESAALLLAR